MSETEKKSKNLKKYTKCERKIGERERGGRERGREKSCVDMSQLDLIEIRCLSPSLQLLFFNSS